MTGDHEEEGSHKPKAPSGPTCPPAQPEDAEQGAGKGKPVKWKVRAKPQV